MSKRVFEEAALLEPIAAGSVISNVKIVGLESRNTARVLGLDERDFGAAVDRTYRYSEEALRAAIPLYEGASVYNGHLPSTYDESGRRVFRADVHSNADLVGWLENVRYVRGQGLFGDLHVLESHPISKTLMEVSRRNPSKLALSHEAVFNELRLENGRVVISRIEAVEGVALINERPGTTNGLFEKAYERPGSLFESMRGIRQTDSGPDKYAEPGSLFRAMRRWG